MEIQFDLAGFNEYERALARMIALLSDMRWFWPRLVPLFIEWMGERFTSEGEFGGEHWAALSPDYLARKMLLYPDKGILYATGQLRRHVSRPKRIATPTSLTFVIDDFPRKDGKTMEIAWFQSGTDRMPARPVIPHAWEAGSLPLVIREQIDEVAQLAIDEMAAKLGLK